MLVPGCGEATDANGLLAESSSAKNLTGPCSLSVSPDLVNVDITTVTNDEHVDGCDTSRSRDADPILPCVLGAVTALGACVRDTVPCPGHD